MKKYFCIQPRKSGKTSKAVYEFLKDPDNSFFVAPNIAMAKYASEMITNNNNKSNFISAHELIEKIRGRIIKNIILDEYLFFNNKEDIYQTINIYQPENLYLFSTLNQSYDREMFYFVKKHKQSISYEDLLVKCSNELPYYTKEQIYSLYYNFLTDEDVTLIDNYPANQINPLYNIK